VPPLAVVQRDIADEFTERATGSRIVRITQTEIVSVAPQSYELIVVARLYKEDHRSLETLGRNIDGFVPGFVNRSVYLDNTDG
jgi:hypothetical protein